MSYDGPEDRVSLAELAGYFQVSKREVHRWIQGGDICSFKVGGRRYCSADQVVTFELGRGRFNARPSEREALAIESRNRLRNFLASRRGPETKGGALDDLLRRVERLERLLDALPRHSAKEAA